VLLAKGEKKEKEGEEEAKAITIAPSPHGF
jgi:hypothetical protein